MRTGILAWGSEGDIRPFVSLANALSSRGHEVDLVISSIDYTDFEGMIEGDSISLSTTTPIPHDREVADRMSAMAISNPSPLEHFRFLLDNLIDPIEDELMEQSLRLCEECDVVLKHLAVHTLSMAAEKTGTPLVDITPTAAVVPSPDLRLPGVPWLGRGINSLLWSAASALLSRLVRERYNRLRKRLGLGPVSGPHRWLIESSDLTIIGSSRAFFPETMQWWNDAKVVGSLLPRRDNGRLSFETGGFLESGPAPVYCTFGSMMHFEPQPDELMEMVSSAILDAGQRGIVQCAREDLQWRPSSDDILLVGKTPHRQVFPCCRAVIHHAGAGTTHTVTGCGLPSIPVMYGVDQLLWGPILHGKGVAPKPLLRRKLKRRDLSRAIEEACEDLSMTERAKDLAGVMSKEDGIGTAIALIEEMARRDQ